MVELLLTAQCYCGVVIHKLHAIFSLTSFSPCILLATDSSHKLYVQTDQSPQTRFPSYTAYTVYMIYLAVALIWWFGKLRLYRQIKCTPFSQAVGMGFLSMQYSKPPIKMLTSCILRVIHQIFNSPMLLCIRYICLGEYSQTPCLLNS